MTALADLLDYLPATYGGESPDPLVVRWLTAEAHELARLRRLLEALRSTTVPARADDTVRGLSRWERTIRLPVAPPDATAGQRRGVLLGHFLGRHVASGVDWRAALTRAMDSDDWTADEHTPGPNQITFTVPYPPDSYTFGRFLELARELTPANQQLVMAHTGGFIVGESHVGDAL